MPIRLVLPNGPGCGLARTPLSVRLAQLWHSELMARETSRDYPRYRLGTPGA